MAKRGNTHSTGDKAASATKMAFEELDYAVNDIVKDYGEDFFVVTHDEASRIVEPARIFVQSKGTDANGGWTEYVDPSTVRNWVSGNELVVLVKQNLRDKMSKYCIPEEEFNYFEVVEYIIKEKNIPIKCNREFTAETPQHLVWGARIRHYERMVLLYLPDNDGFKDIPAARLIALEFLKRCGLIAESGFRPSTAALGALNADFCCIPEDYVDSENLTARQRVLLVNWFAIVSKRLQELCPCLTYRAAFIEQLGIMMQLAGFDHGLDHDDFDCSDIDQSLHFMWS